MTLTEKKAIAIEKIGQLMDVLFTSEDLEKELAAAREEGRLLGKAEAEKEFKGRIAAMLGLNVEEKEQPIACAKEVAEEKLEDIKEESEPVEAPVEETAHI